MVELDLGGQITVPSYRPLYDLKASRSWRHSKRSGQVQHESNCIQRGPKSIAAYTNNKAWLVLVAPATGDADFIVHCKTFNQ